MFQLGKSNGNDLIFHTAGSLIDWPILNFKRSKGTLASPSNLGSGYLLFYVKGDGYFNDKWNDTVAIDGSLDGPSPNYGGKLRFSTKAVNGYVAERMRITENGNVGIGTITPSHKLAVNGTVRAKEVIVDTGWADYVFADDYQLAPLDKVEAHIREKRHLPGIPSAQEVAEKGVSVGEMQALLLAKIEELTLHQISQEKRISSLERENTELRRQLTNK